MGSLAIQIAKADGARVTAVDRAGKAADDARARRGSRDRLSPRKTCCKGGERYDVILDVASTLWFDVCAPILTPGGTYVPIGHADFGRATGRMGGRILGSLPLFIGLLLRALLDPNKRKNFKILGKPAAMARFKALLESGQLTPIIGRTFPLGEAAAAMRCMEDGRVGGQNHHDAAGLKAARLRVWRPDARRRLEERADACMRRRAPGVGSHPRFGRGWRR